MEEGGIIRLSLYCHHQNDSCIKMASDESLFNVSLTVRDKITRVCPQTTTFFEETGNSKRNRPEALLLTNFFTSRFSACPHLRKTATTTTATTTTTTTTTTTAAAATTCPVYV